MTIKLRHVYLRGDVTDAVYGDKIKDARIFANKKRRQGVAATAYTEITQRFSFQRFHDAILHPLVTQLYDVTLNEGKRGLLLHPSVFQTPTFCVYENLKKVSWN